MVKSAVGIRQQCGAVLTKPVRCMTLTVAIKRDHLPDSLFLPFYPRHIVLIIKKFML